MAKSYKVERLGEIQPKLSADDWRSPLVVRLLREQEYEDGEAPFSINSRTVDSVEEKRNLRLAWQGSGTSCQKCKNTYQAHVITEMAALGFACVATHDGLNAEISEVTQRGDKADYWLNGKQCLLEVSGQQTGNLDRLRDEKAAQLLSNPYGKPGYVCVANFEQRESYLWYYENQEK